MTMSLAVILRRDDIVTSNKFEENGVLFEDFGLSFPGVQL